MPFERCSWEFLLLRYLEVQFHSGATHFYSCNVATAGKTLQSYLSLSLHTIIWLALASGQQPMWHRLRREKCSRCPCSSLCLCCLIHVLTNDPCPFPHRVPWEGYVCSLLIDLRSQFAVCDNVQICKQRTLGRMHLCSDIGCFSHCNEHSNGYLPRPSVLVNYILIFRKAWCTLEINACAVRWAQFIAPSARIFG